MSIKRGYKPKLKNEVALKKYLKNANKQSSKGSRRGNSGK